MLALCNHIKIKIKNLVRNIKGDAGAKDGHGDVGIEIFGVEVIVGGAPKQGGGLGPNQICHLSAKHREAKHGPILPAGGVSGIIFEVVFQSQPPRQHLNSAESQK